MSSLNSNLTASTSPTAHQRSFSPLRTYDRPWQSRTRIDEEFAVETVESVAALLGYLHDWKSLIPQVARPNAFYEPYFLLPALNSFHRNSRLRFVMVYYGRKGGPAEEQLCGFFPLEESEIDFFPRSSWKLLSNPFLYSSLPLLDLARMPETLTAFLKWAKQSDISLLEMERIPAEGGFETALRLALRESAIVPFKAEQWERACLRQDDPNKPIRRDLQRKRRRLAELGKLEFRVLTDASSLSTWQKSFLQLEESGWKGREGTALNQDENQRELFEAVTRQAFAREKLEFCGLFLNDAPVAMKCNLLSGNVGYAWKIAFDEEFARYSPGMLLECDYRSFFRKKATLQSVDSCACPGQPMFQRLWPGTTRMQTLYVPTGHFLSRMYCSARPLWRSLKQVT